MDKTERGYRKILTTYMSEIEGVAIIKGTSRNPTDYNHSTEDNVQSYK